MSSDGVSELEISILVIYFSTYTLPILMIIITKFLILTSKQNLEMNALERKLLELVSNVEIKTN